MASIIARRLADALKKATEPKAKGDSRAQEALRRLTKKQQQAKNEWRPDFDGHHKGW